MLIFIRHGEISKNDNLNLSSAGYVRRNTLSEFFLQKYNKNLNIPEHIIIPLQQNICFQTVSLLAYDSKLKIEKVNTEHSDFDNLVSVLKKNINTDILVCMDHYQLIKLIESLIYKIYKKKIKLKWSKNPLNKEDIDDYSSIFVFDPIKHVLNVYNQFDVIYNEKYKRYDVDFNNIQENPIISINFNKTYIQWIKSFFS